MESELFGVRFLRASSQTSRWRERARAFLSDRARLGPGEKETDQLGHGQQISSHNGHWNFNEEKQRWQQRRLFDVDQKWPAAQRRHS